jgi:hypothetical protein
MDARGVRAVVALGVLALAMSQTRAAAAQTQPLGPPSVTGAAFYESVGRPDLATSYRTRFGLKLASRIAGAVAIVSGGLWLVYQRVDEGLANDCGGSNSPPVCDRTHWGPDLVMLGGLAALIVPAFFDTEPVSAAERARLARGASRDLSWSFSAAPAPSGQGGTLLLGGRF